MTTSEAAGPVEDAAGFRLSPQQERLFRRYPEGAVPRLTLVRRLESGADTGVLAERWARCVADLEILRTACRVPAWSRMPQQVIDDVVAAPLPVEEIDADALDADALSARIDAIAQEPCDPTRTPSVEARVLRTPQGAWLVLSGGAHLLDGDGLRLLSSWLSAETAPAEALQYADVAEWAASLPEEPDAAAHIAFWRTRAAELGDAPLAFPELASRNGTRRHVIEIDWPACWSARAPSPAAIVTLASLFASRCAGGEDAFVALRRDGRDIEDLRAVVGPLARWLPLRLDRGRADGFAAWERAAEDEIRRVTERQHLWEAGLGDAPAPRLAIGVEIVPEPADARIIRLDPEPDAPTLVLRIEPQTRRLLVLAATDAFDVAAARRLGRMFAALAAAAAADREAPVDALDWLDAESRAEFVALGDGPAGEAPADLLPQRIAAQVARDGGAPAIVQGETTLSYADLWRRAGLVASAIPAPAGADERPVAVRLPRGPDALCAMIGAWRAGRPYTPFDPALPEARLSQMRRAADPVHEIAAIEGAAADVPERAPGDLAYLLFTSGSTGTPKAVCVTHAGLAASTAIRTRHYGADPARFLVVSPLGFDSSVAGLYWTLATGGTVVLPTDAEAEDAGALARLVREHRVTHTLMLPGLYDAVLEAAAPGDLDSLAVVVVAGEACPAALVERHRALLPHARLENEYGPTEATVWCSAARLDREPGTRVSIGRAVPGMTVRVVDRALRPLPPGVPGEIVIAGPGLARGYAGRPAETAQRFLPDPDASTPGARLYRVGDRGMLTGDGRILYQGRTDNQVKVRGHRIELEEIEARLLAEPTIRAAAATVRDGRLVAYVVPRDGEAARYEAAVAALPAWMRPHAFVTLDALPRGRTGKLDRAALPDPVEASRQTRSRPPRDALEARVAAIWSELLKCGEVGIDDDFFRLGGDSLLALRAATRMRQAGIDASPRMLLKHPTIAALLDAAPRIAVQSPAAPDESAPVVEAAPLTPLQAWLVERAGGIPARYDQTLRVAAREPLDLALLERAFAEVVSRHEALRLRFEETPEGWRQRPGPAIVEPPLLYDLARVPQAARAGIEAGAWERLHAGLDPAAGRHARLALVRRGADMPDLLLAVAHHLVMDAASWRIVMEDLDFAYRALRENRPIAWPASAGSFTTYAARIRDLAPDRLGEPFWAEQDAIAVPALPRDGTDAANREGDVADHVASLSPEQTESLARRAPGALSSGLDAILTATLAETLAGFTGSDTIRVDREHHGRADAVAGVSTESTVGWFTTIHPVVLRVPGSPGPARLRALLDQIERVPDDGFGYGLRSTPTTSGEVLFNFLGRTDETTAPDALFTVEDGPTGRERDPAIPRRCLLEIDAEIVTGRLRLHWRYPAGAYDAGTIARLASDHVARLAALADTLGAEEGS
ncbi:hypothetical protein GCM10011322_39950 [Salinarimonas ramus]|uniref:Carrier domain-containing protein n=2 Tax=Salinarimonas ramus TaxID=690164 RepID=A0A917QG54_9HYPH|nr:hypothetical protein GCM10011322_39950 [Salinarimonas ramus]